MAGVKATRNYQSAVRQEQARATRHRVIGAAREQFLARGYTATTMKDIATAAHVSEMTIYVSFESKRRLLQAVIEDAIGGADSTPDPAAFDAIARLDTPRERLRAYVEASCDVLARTSPIHAVIRGASDSDEFAVGLKAGLLQARLQSNRKLLTTYLAGGLRAGLTLDDAAHTYCALTSPEVHHLMTVELGRSERQHRRWLVTTLERELLAAPR